MADRILVAEDEAIIALDLKEKLEAIGYTVVDVATSGEDACTMADHHRPDLVLMDIMMPGSMDGTDAAKRIREKHNIPSIFLTAFATAAVVSRAKRAGAYGYIVKPFSEDQLKAAIEVALTRSMLDQALRISEARYRAIVENSDDFILRFSPDFRMIFHNRAYAGWARRQSGAPHPAAQWTASFGEIDQWLRRKSDHVRKASDIVFHDGAITGPDGHERHYHWELKGIFDDAALCEYLIVGRDVTTFNRIRSELCDINLELEEIVHDRAEAINELQLQLSEAEAAANILISNLLLSQQPGTPRPLRQVAGQLAPYIEKMRDSGRIANILEKMGDVGITLTSLPETTQNDPRAISHRLKELTPIELEVAGLIHDGRLSKEIAERLHISIRTVETHRLNIRKKLGLCKNTTNLREFLIAQC